MSEQLNVLKSEIDMNKLPKHIAIIMDGNGRWAKEQGKPRVYGHEKGVRAVRETTEIAAELGISYLTLYAFSTENWNRPLQEVQALMALLVETINQEVSTLNKNNIRLQAIGDLSKLPERSQIALQEAIDNTKQNTRMTLVLALNYSARWEIMKAVKEIATQVKNDIIDVSDINETSFEKALSTKGMPDPELLIRTSGETRLSNFLLWQIAYAELYFMPIFWPDFRKEHLCQAILDFQRRERRFGMTSEQVAS
ncbi:MAG: isoprenyl transferase [Saprospiraceae bacterium]|nr:isoprenyl transferase [Saprospiraceae bacterium]